ncbi:MAG: hypothetical protein LV480_06375 [Methylacidiphilales bacterium]|nr:hypothetical protein [Candidatus Methylacidiphilales bacterium]
MSEPTEPPAASPPPGSTGLRINWHRVRVYLLSILIMLTMWFSATLLTIQLYPRRVVDGLLAQLPFKSSTGSVYWVNRRTLRIDNVKLGDFFYADSIIVVASPFGLWRHHIAKVEVIGGQLFTKPLYAMMDRTGSGNSNGLDWVIGRLEISRGTVMLNNLIQDTSIPVRLGVRQPIVLNGLRLGKPDSSPEMTQERSAEIVNVAIVSPVDPLTPVFFFPLIRVHYTYTEIWRHHVREIDMVRPTMFLGQDLFWLAKQFKSQNKPAVTHGLAAPWEVSRFEVQFGQLAVNAFGQPVVHFPFFFDTKVDNIRLDQLDQISAKSTIPIESLTQDYPDYKIRIVNLHGNLYFSWPPSDKTANNVVNQIYIDELSWNGIPVKNGYCSVTFDPEGVYGRLYGACEGGQLNGNFEFYYTQGFTWNADFFANKINCQPIAEKLAGKYIDMTGELDGDVDVQGRATEILDCKGTLELPNPGLLKIKSMDELLDRIPANLSSMKRDALKLSITAFQTYPYDKGELKVGYDPKGGVSTLKLDGPRGKRQFDVYLHPWSLSDNSGDGQGAGANNQKSGE